MIDTRCSVNTSMMPLLVVGRLKPTTRSMKSMCGRHLGGAVATSPSGDRAIDALSLWENQRTNSLTRWDRKADTKQEACFRAFG